MATSGYLFTPLKLVGTICLIWLSSSLSTALTEKKPFEEKVETASLLKLFWKSRVIRILTPKGPAFYVAFLPHFVSLSGPIFLQFAILITPFVSVAILTRLFSLLLPVICERSSKGQLCWKYPPELAPFAYFCMRSYCTDRTGGPIEPRYGLQNFL